MKQSILMIFALRGVLLLVPDYMDESGVLLTVKVYSEPQRSYQPSTSSFTINANAF